MLGYQQLSVDLFSFIYPTSVFLMAYVPSERACQLNAPLSHRMKQMPPNQNILKPPRRLDVFYKFVDYFILKISNTPVLKEIYLQSRICLNRTFNETL